MVMHLGAGFGEVWGWFGGGLGRLGRGLGKVWGAWVAPSDSGFIISNLKKLGLGSY